jgi:hypothetical protein
MRGLEGTADRAGAWSDYHGVMPQADARVLGGGTYPSHEQHWTAVQKEPGKPIPEPGRLPRPAEVGWGRFAARPSAPMGGLAVPT